MTFSRINMLQCFDFFVWSVLYMYSAVPFKLEWTQQFEVRHNVGFSLLCNVLLNYHGHLQCLNCTPNQKLACLHFYLKILDIGLQYFYPSWGPA